MLFLVSSLSISSSSSLSPLPVSNAYLIFDNDLHFSRGAALLNVGDFTFVIFCEDLSWLKKLSASFCFVVGVSMTEG